MVFMILIKQIDFISAVELSLTFSVNVNKVIKKDFRYRIYFPNAAVKMLVDSCFWLFCQSRV